MPDSSTPPAHYDSTAELSDRLASVKVDNQNGNGGYASLPPPGSRGYSPTATIIPSEYQLPPPHMDQPPMNYRPYHEDPRCLDYQQNPHAHPPFSPVGNEWTGTASPYNTYTLPPPAPPMPLGPLNPMSPPLSHSHLPQHPMHQGQNEPRPGSDRFPSLGEPFMPLTPISDFRRDRGLEQQPRRGASGVYRPPHILKGSHQPVRHGPPNQQLRSPQGVFLTPKSFRGPRRQYGSDSVDWHRDGPNGMRNTNRMTHGENRRWMLEDADSINVPYTPRPHDPAALRGMYSPGSEMQSPVSSRDAPVSQLTTPIPSQRVMSGRGSQFTGPMGQYGVNSGVNTGLRMMSGAYTPPSMREQPLFNGPRYPGQRSMLLEDFRINKSDKQWDIQDMTGYIVEFSGDQHGSRFIQTKIADSGPRERQKIFDEIMPSALELMQDVFGNYVVQKMFEVGDLKQNSLLAKKMEGKVLTLSMHMYGCRVVQKAVEHLPKDLRGTLVVELEPHILECVRSSNANHVIQRLISLDPPKALSAAFNGHLQELAMNPFGCRVIQKMFEQLDEEYKRDMLDEMHPIATKLMQDQFGNYVVQSVIAVGAEHDRQKLVDGLKGRMLAMSRHKFASNVCEKALQHAKPEDRRALIEEMIARKPDGSTQVPILLGDAFGNFPLQYALTCADDDQRAELLDLIIEVLPSIASTPVGKRLSAQLAQWEADGLIATASDAGGNMRAHRKAQDEANRAEPDGVRGSTDDANVRSPSPVSSDSASSNSDEEQNPSATRSRELLRSTASTPVRRIEPKKERRGSTFSRNGSKTTIPSSRSPVPTTNGRISDDHSPDGSAKDDKALETLLH